MSTETPAADYHAGNHQEALPQTDGARIIEETVSEYHISWAWLLSGLSFIIIAGGVLGGLYAVRASGMSSYILGAARSMTAEADRDKQAIETETDIDKKKEFAQHSFNLRNDAANLLNNYWRSNADVSPAVLEELYSILDTLYMDSGAASSLAGVERGKKLAELCVALTRVVSESESIKYLTRLVELAWDRRDFRDLLDRGKALLRTDQNVNGKENYDAIRYITFYLYDKLPVTGYNPGELQLPASSFPREMDDLLKKLYGMKPDDIEVASRYAEFIIDVGRDVFTACATEGLKQMPKEARRDTAVKIIDDMVVRNSDKMRAYLMRYHFKNRFIPSEKLQDTADEDLQTALKLEPSNPETLILLSRDAFVQMGIALRDNKKDQAEKWKKKGEELLRKNVKDNPTYGVAYQYLGDYLVTEGKIAEALQIWETGIKLANRWMVEELLGRIVSVFLDQSNVAEAKKYLDQMSKAVAEIQVTRPQAVKQVINMRQLLTARLYVVESMAAQSKIDAITNAPEEQRKLFTLIQQKRADATQQLDGLLKSFGKTSRNDYVIEQTSIYNRIVPQSLMLAGRLKMDSGMWDSAVEYFQAAMPFASVQEQAMLAAAGAYQQGNQADKATEMLAMASRGNPSNLAVKFAYANSLFRSQMAKTNTDPNALDTVKKELEELEKRRDELRQPWVLDIRLIHLTLAQATLSNSAETILAAQNLAVKQFRELETKTYTLKEDGKAVVKKYSDDIEFVSELVGIYSSLSAIADFDRLLGKLREFPNGEVSYYAARINDALRRDDRDGTIALIGQANGSEKLTPTQKERFVTLLQSIQNENKEDVKSATEKVYGQLKTTFDQNPESLKPQAFFMLANMALDREDYESAKLVRDRLQKVEGENGTMWRYVTIRLLLADKTQDFQKIQQLHEEILRERPNWDMAYVLGTVIEDKFLETNPENAEAKARLVNNLVQAIEKGNVQPAVWGRLVALYQQAGRNDDAKTLLRQAAMRGVSLDAQTGQFPQPYSRMYSQIQESIANEDAQNADTIARQCIALAEKRREKPDLIFSLNLAIGKTFFDSSLFDPAKRHLTIAAKRGGAYVYPLAICIARSGDIDQGFSIILDEIASMPSSTPILLPSMLVLLAQVKPGEAVYQRIDKLMDRVENGERYALSAKLENSDENHELEFDTTKRVRSLLFRFPDSKAKIDPALFKFFPPSADKDKPAAAVTP